MKAVISASILAFALLTSSAPATPSNDTVTETKSPRSHLRTFDDPNETVPASPADGFWRHLHDTAP